ncbi:histidine kinase [Marinobacter sp. C1S70]|uniref:sensor histidine kinase n=1 Tax=Marinobacter sp. C1S70 TaxID=1396859 RepID=UPI0003B7F620|nr:ATP-binding protein [Marinobacter sp. C1S70]ERS83310.1 histidine kinase [Marinobacter sp. C1S70]
MAAVLFFAYNGLVRDFENVLTQRQLLETDSAARIVDQQLQIRLEALKAFSAFLTDGDNLRPLPELKELLGRQPSLERYFEGGLLIFDDKGVAIAENRFVPRRIGTDYSDRPHFREALTSRQAVISRPIIGRTTGLPLLSFLAPIVSDDGDLLGLAGGSINLAESGIIPDSLSEKSNAIFKVLDTGHFTQVDSLTPGAPMPELPPPGENLIIDAALSGVTSGVVTDKSGKRWIYATRHLERVGWLFLRAEPYEGVTGPARASFENFLLLSVMAALILATAAWLLGRTATRPLEHMSTRIRAMVDGASDTRHLKPKGPPETRNLALAFNRLMEEREALDQMKDQFVATVSHELRTPLTSINGSLKLLDREAAGELPEKAKKMVEVALRNGEQLQLLISDLLDFNKAIAGKMMLQIGTIQVSEALEQAIEGNRSMATHYGVSLCAVPAAEPLVVRADPQRLRQILDNFISNAIKFSPTGAAVQLSARAVNQNTIRFIISDHGPGVDEQFIPHLFERFAQANPSSKQAQSGTGLGLAICRELAHLMHGQVGYYYQQGAHFWLDIPRQETSREPDHEVT